MSAHIARMKQKLSSAKASMSSITPSQAGAGTGQSTNVFFGAAAVTATAAGAFYATRTQSKTAEKQTDARNSVRETVSNHARGLLAWRACPPVGLPNVLRFDEPLMP